VKWLLSASLLLGACVSAQAYPPRFWGDLPGGGDVCLYENLTAGHSEEFPAVVDTELGRPEYGYLGCRRSALDWPAGPNHVRLAVRNAQGTSAWAEAIIPRPAGAVSSARLARGPVPQPPGSTTVLSRFGGGQAKWLSEGAAKNIAWPASVTSNHVAVLVVSYFNAGNDGGAPKTINAPSDFTLRRSDVIDTYLSYASIVEVYTRDLAGTESGNVSISFSGQVYANAVMTVLAGGGDLSFASISSPDTGDSSDATAPSASGTAGQGLVAVFGIGDPPGTTNASPDGFTLADDATADTNGARIYFRTVTTDGATGAATWDFTNTRAWGGYSLLFNGAAAPAITLQSDGSLLHKPSPAGGDAKLYLTTAGAIVAKTAPGAGDRRISLSGGNWLAN